jgi:hypothetical protein
MTTIGIVLVAVGNECHKEAQICVRSIRQIYKDLPITLFTDNSNEINGVNSTILVKPSNDIFLNKVFSIQTHFYVQILMMDLIFWINSICYFVMLHSDKLAMI